MNTPTMKDSVVLVTGGGRGIGRAMALAFAQAGADVAMCSRNQAEVDGVAGEIKKLGRRVLAIQADVSKKPEVDAMVKRATSEFGHIDVLINNAGILFLGTLAETEEDIWDNVIDVNLKSCYLCSRAVAPGMTARKKGNIINVSSIAGFKAWPGQLVYGVSKAGVVMLTRELARELGHYGIRVNAIAPGTTYTRMNEPQSNDPEFTRQRLPNVPLGRLGEPEDMVGAALFLASDAASWITGQTIAIDGGYLA